MKKNTSQESEDMIIDILILLMDGERISVRELAKRMNKLPAYTWVLMKVNDMIKKGIINAKMTNIITQKGNKISCKMICLSDKK